jgi:hypothetical protein
MEGLERLCETRKRELDEATARYEEVFAELDRRRKENAFERFCKEHNLPNLKAAERTPEGRLSAMIFEWGRVEISKGPSDLVFVMPDGTRSEVIHELWFGEDAPSYSEPLEECHWNQAEKRWMPWCKPGEDCERVQRLLDTHGAEAVAAQKALVSVYH